MAGIARNPYETRRGKKKKEEEVGGAIGAGITAAALAINPVLGVAAAGANIIGSLFPKKKKYSVHGVRKRG